VYINLWPGAKAVWFCSHSCCYLMVHRTYVKCGEVMTLRPNVEHPMSPEETRTSDHDAKLSCCRCMFLTVKSLWQLCNIFQLCMALPSKFKQKTGSSAIFAVFAGHQISCVSDRVCNFSPWASIAVEFAKETKFDTKVA